MIEYIEQCVTSDIIQNKKHFNVMYKILTMLPAAVR